MKGRALIRAGLVLALIVVLPIHCVDPNLPVFDIVSPEQGAQFVADAPPHTLTVEVRVPLPGCGASVFPVAPETFDARLTGRNDCDVFHEEDVTAAFGDAVADPETGAYTWNGEIELPAFGEYTLDLTIANEQGDGSGRLDLRLEPPVSEFPGGSFFLSLSCIHQEPASCLAPNIISELILPVIEDLIFPATFPSGAEILDHGNAYPMTIVPGQLPIPPIDLVLSLDEAGNDILMDGPDDFTFDLTGQLPVPGLDCIITADLTGALHDTDPADVDGALSGALTIEASPGGECALPSVGGECSLILGLDLDNEID